MKKLIASIALGLAVFGFAGASFAQAASAPEVCGIGGGHGHGRPQRAAAAPAEAASAAAAPAPVPNKGDTALMTVATALVILMTIPGLALFYGGLVRSKNMLSVLMQVFMIFALISVLWVVYGYSLAFTAGNPFFGRLDKLFLKGMTPDSVAATFSKGVYLRSSRSSPSRGPSRPSPTALIVGAFAERIKFSAVLLFSVLWFTFAYLPIAHMVWYWDGPDAITDAATLAAVTANAGLHVGQGRARLRRRHGRAHQRGDRRPGGGVHDRQACRLRQGIDDAAQPDADDGRCLAAVGGLVRIQRRLQPRSQRRRPLWRSSTPSSPRRLPRCPGSPVKR